MVSRRATGLPLAMLAASWRMLRSPLLAGRLPAWRAVIAASQSIQAIGVPSVKLVSSQMQAAKSGRGRKVPCRMISSVPASLW